MLAIFSGNSSSYEQLNLTRRPPCVSHGGITLAAQYICNLPGTINPSSVMQDDPPGGGLQGIQPAENFSSLRLYSIIRRYSILRLCIIGGEGQCGSDSQTPGPCSLCE